jgi:hypothetical protein
MKARKKKAPTRKDAPLGQPTDPRCICHFGIVCELHHDKPWSTTIATVLVIRAVDETVPTGTIPMLFLQ